MEPTDEATHRSVYEHPGEYVTFREAEEVDPDEGMMEIRMPIASTGEVRNEGDDPLTASELRGMASQVNSDTRGVFPEHGMSEMVDRGQYSQFEKLGYWTDADLQREASGDGEDLLMATARMPDPETLPAATGDYRTGLAILKEQAKRGIPIMSSIGWREDDNSPGGVDLLETSIVGIAADPRTNTEDDAAEIMARSAVEAGADPHKLVTEVQRAVGDDDWSADLRFFRVVAPEDREDEFDDTVLGVGASFPESGVYVDWHTSAFPDELENPHVSEYGSISDLQKATGNDIVDMTGPPGARSGADSDSTDMTDDDAPDDETDGGTTEEQSADAEDGETTERAPDDVTEDDLLTFTARHFDGMDESDLMQAVDAADASYIGECDAEALYDFVSIVTGAEYGTVEDAMMELMDGGENSGDGYEDKEDDDENEQSADTSETDTQSNESGGDDRAAELESRLDELESELQAVRSGETGVDTPDTESDTDDGGDSERNADADNSETGDDTDADEQRDDTGDTLRDGWLADKGKL